LHLIVVAWWERSSETHPVVPLDVARTSGKLPISHLSANGDKSKSDPSHPCP
jgi:hypothetical protein